MRKNFQRNFRPSEKNQEWLTFAERLGLNISKVINEVLQENLPRHLEAKGRKLREALSVPER